MCYVMEAFCVTGLQAETQRATDVIDNDEAALSTIIDEVDDMISLKLVFSTTIEIRHV